VNQLFLLQNNSKLAHCDIRKM